MLASMIYHINKPISREIDSNRRENSLKTRQIIVRDLSKTYRVPVRDAGLLASLKSLWAREYRSVEAVKSISFTIEEGEMVGFLGPNGAGKTSTLKMLAGLLYPTTGEALVAGFVPWKREYEYLRRISMVLGNKSQMLWDIPPRDSFRVLGEIYGIPSATLNRTLAELFDLLDIHHVLNKPVRTLSLGERMKCELVGALLYRPQVLFLDEPTLGLDISTQRRLRDFISEYNRRSGATIILTSHYMADVEALCPRVIMINHGRLIYDGSLRTLANRLAPHKLLRLVVNDECTISTADLILPANVQILERENATWTLNVPKSEVAAVTSHLLNSLPVLDLAIEEPPIEAVIDHLYQGGEL
jgi:ABC-2 type transport system ATP-binding protein